nr:retrovirus-related Pol polyprotein from transposon TNT 1-94 [Tanacetum cinerariifolium]
FAPILGYGDLVQGNVTINRVYYVKGLNHNLFLVGQFYDADLEVAFRKSTCFVRDLQGIDLLIAWLWHRRLSHLNFDYINLLSKKDIVIGLPKLKYVKDQLCSSYELSKATRSSFKSKAILSSKGRLNLLHMDLCGPMRVASINGKKYILVIVDDYSRYTWTLFLCSKDETPKVLKDFLTMIQRNLQAPVITIRTDKGTEILNKTLNAFFKEERIKHQTSTARTPEQNGVVERRNHTLVEAARTMLSASQLPLFFWDKMKEKGDQCILVGYSTQTKGYRIYNKRTRMIVESIHIRFDEIKEVLEMSIANNTSGLVPQRQDVSSSADEHVPSQQELDMLFGPLYDEFLNTGSNPSMNIQSTSAPSTHTYVNAEENNNDQAKEGEHIPDDEFTNPLCALTPEVVESSSHNIGQYRRDDNPLDERSPAKTSWWKFISLTDFRSKSQTYVSRPQLKSNQSRDKVLPNNSQLKVKKTQVEVHPRIPSVSNKMKSVTAYKDSLHSKTLNDNAYCPGKENGENILQSIDEGPFKMGKFRETLAEGALHLGAERDRVVADLTLEEKERYKADIRATHTLLQGGQDINFDDDVDEPPVQDLELNVENVFQANQCDAFDFDVDETHTMLMVDDNVRNQFRHNVVQNVGNLVRHIAIQNQAHAEGNGNGINGVDHYANNYIVKPRKWDAAYLHKQMHISQKEEVGIQLTSEEFDFMAAAGACEETKRANANCTLENNLQQASTSGTQSDKALVYDSDYNTPKLVATE